MNRQPTSVLLVEDNPADARLLRVLLQDTPRYRFDLHVAETLHDGIAMLGRVSPRIVLLDLSLPDSTGLDTLTHLHTAAPHLPIIVFTGHEDEEQGLAAVQAGAQDYLVKGDVGTPLLLRTIQYAIERNRAQSELRRSQEAYRSLINDVFDDSAVSIFILDKDFRVVWVNHATETYFGLPRDAMLGKDKRTLIDDELQCIFADMDAYRTALHTAYDANDFAGRFECHVTAEGSRAERWLEHWSQPIRSGLYAGGRIEHYADITDRKKAEAALQLVAAIDERQRIARELHDSVTQSIFSSKVMAESALRQWDINPARSRDLVEEIQHVATGTLSELRILLLELRPQSILEVDLRQLVDLLVRSMQGHKQLLLTLNMDDLPTLPQTVQLGIYRIVQEALTNVLKHAGAQRVTVSMRWEDERLHVTVEDDGQGFEPDDVSPSSLGISAMRERAQEVNGNVTVDSAPGTGTRLHIWWPANTSAG